MANIYQIKEDLSEVPFAELKVYEALEKLGKNFYIFFLSVSFCLSGCFFGFHQTFIFQKITAKADAFITDVNTRADYDTLNFI